jgi:GntR family transcriptional regulator
MAFVITRKNGIPIYIQLKNQIKDLVQRGVWATGHRLPTERELASQLGVSRNTVSLAYDELEAEGIIARRQGSGTFVIAGEGSLERVGRRERLLKIIDLALEEASHMGFSIDDFLAIVLLRVRERKEILGRVQVAFVECNREQLDYFTRELELGSGMAIHAILLDDLRASPSEARAQLSKMDLVVTTFYHQDEVCELGVAPEKILGIALEPDLASIVRIARIPRESILPVVCLSESFAQSIIQALASTELTFASMPIITTKNNEELKQALQGTRAVIVSPGRKRDVKENAPPGTEVVEFIFRPDAGSINMLKAALLRIKDSPEKERVAGPKKNI